MGCAQWRDVLSALLDGEESPAERLAAEDHLTGCGGCQAWYDRAAAVTRRARLSLTGDGVDLTDTVLAALPAPSPRQRPWHRITVGLRAVLGLIGVLQLVLGLAQVGRGAASPHLHASGPLASGHLWHESAAWNIAVGAGFLFVAARRTPPTGLVPMLSAFVGTLVLLSVNDLATGRVDPARLVSHAFLLAGYVIVVAMSRAHQAPGGPADRARDGSRWRLTEDVTPTPTGLRLLPPPYPGSAHHREDAAA
ncbi:zf-HC2 domain-containing protein [Micromonospora sp. WMMA1363]|uniref:zf-HC2 domain-containing protein n=1 Tax=Micromonospora sp. WMMA1363 TaxID=3053985 RepID=UPI00259CD24A|nr:zf-HC2 domain-containing protein [Micromonospora sp. WMMA1363]MDM4719522.1 zf-HC2 domain-containing protein [Micromonospora sp. WMMA1363]